MSKILYGTKPGKIRYTRADSGVRFIHIEHIWGGGRGGGACAYLNLTFALPHTPGAASPLALAPHVELDTLSTVLT